MNKQEQSTATQTYNPVTQFIGKTIWGFCDTFHINLGKHAPTVFGWMVGRKGGKVDDSRTR